MNGSIRNINFTQLFAQFTSPITSIDCGQLCAPHNPSGIPFCCDICHAVPVAYRPEWEHLAQNTDLWRIWLGEECSEDPGAVEELFTDTPQHLLLLACRGPQHCQRQFRTISCRQFPFFPYITRDFRFIGLAGDWEFDEKCWILSHLDQVSTDYREEFVHTFDLIFSYWMHDFDSYAALSEEVREHYLTLHRFFPLLHRDGHNYHVDPTSEELTRIDS